MTSQWTTWRCLNRLRTSVACSKEQRKKWGYYDRNTTCDCGVSSDMCWNARSLHSCSLNDLLQFNETVCRTMEDSGLMTRCIFNTQQCNTHGNAPKGDGSYLRPKPHIQHTHPPHLSTRTQTSTNHKSTHCNRMG